MYTMSLSNTYWVSQKCEKNFTTRLKVVRLSIEKYIRVEGPVNLSCLKNIVRLSLVKAYRKKGFRNKNFLKMKQISLVEINTR